jgi:hypothetical protein
MKIIKLSVFLLLICIHVQSQNLIGYSNKEIRQYMKQNCSAMNYNNVVNNKFNYLKYSDNDENQTLLFFLDSDSICKKIRIIYVLGLKDQKTREYNTMYTKSGENELTEKKNGNDYILQAFDEKWSFVVTIEQKK